MPVRSLGLPRPRFRCPISAASLEPTRCGLELPVNVVKGPLTTLLRGGRPIGHVPGSFAPASPRRQANVRAS
jgi:hypothetical protein